MRETKHEGANDAHIGKADQALRAALEDILGLSAEQIATFDADSALFGALPELDSMAVATLLTDLEDRLDIMIDDDDVDMEAFETFGSLCALLTRKLGG